MDVYVPVELRPSAAESRDVCNVGGSTQDAMAWPGAAMASNAATGTPRTSLRIIDYTTPELPPR